MFVRDKDLLALLKRDEIGDIGAGDDLAIKPGHSLILHASIIIIDNHFQFSFISKKSWQMLFNGAPGPTELKRSGLPYIDSVHQKYTKIVFIKKTTIYQRILFYLF